MKDEKEPKKRSLKELFFGCIKQRRQRKLYADWCEQEFFRLSLLEMKTNLRIQKYQLRLLKMNEKRLKKKPFYVH